MIILINLLISVLITQAEWTIIFDKFKTSNFPDTDADGWDFKSACTGTSNCGGGVKANTCNRNPNRVLELGGNCFRIETIFSNLVPHFQVRYYFDVYFLSREPATNYFYFYIDNVIKEQRSYTNSDIVYNRDNCDTSYDNGFDVKSYRNDISHTSSNLYVKFCSTIQDGGPGNKRRVGLRSIQFLINTCHKTCSGCTLGDGPNQCTSCFYGSPTSGVCPPCPQNTLFIDVSTSICQQECSRGKLADSDLVCQDNSKLSILLTEFSASSFATYGNWNFILDPVYYYLTTQTRIQTCNSNSYVGPLQDNEGFQRSQPYLIKATFLLTGWQDQTSLLILLDGVPKANIYQESGIIKSTNCLIILDTTDTCGQTIRIETIIQTTKTNSILKFKGNIRLETSGSWSMRDVQVDQGVCETNCDTCATSTTCSVCSSGYVRHKGTCLLSCPQYSTLSGSVCTDFDEEKPTSKYEIKAFYDTSTQIEEINSLIQTYTPTMPNKNQKTGQVYGYLSDKRVLGGALTWHRAAITKNLPIANPHYAYRYRMNVVLGEGRGDFSYSFSGDATTYDIVSGTPSTTTSNIWGQDTDEKQYSINRQNSHTSGTIAIVLDYQCTSSSEENGFVVVSSFCKFKFKVQCAPFCNACTGPLYTDCTSWPAITDPTIASYTPLTCQSHRYLDKTVSPYTCPNCSDGCDICTDSITCTQCYSSFYLESGLCRCYPEFYKSGSSCLPCNNICSSCSGPSISNCLGCYDSHHRMLDKNQCICLPHYQEDPNSLICLPVCGDMIVMQGEDCDDGNDIQYDGCYKCKYQCALNCSACIMGVCYECNIGYSLQQQSKTCLPICGDHSIVVGEQCDDGNNRPFDGCYGCELSCQSECDKCQNGICMQCKAGWYLQFLNGKCLSLCGDGIVASNEQCDDGNVVPFDGCFNCQYSCTKYCKLCAQTTCISCIQGFTLNLKTKLCQPVCGDLLIVANEQCDDGNTIPYDGCYNCQFSCQPQCTNCQKGECQKCNYPGWGWDPFTKRCVTISLDGYLVPQFEQCDDGNQFPFDGCFINQISCPEGCLDCINEGCLNCNPFWSLDLIEHKCYPICGDGVSTGNEECDFFNYQPVVCNDCRLKCPDHCQQCSYGSCLQCQPGYERIMGDEFEFRRYVCREICGDLKQNVQECDDGNLIPFDGCFQCNFSCQEECLTCSNAGNCLQCKDGYLLNEADRQCVPICGDGQIQRQEECEDGISSYVSCTSCQFKQIEFCDQQNYGICSLCQQDFELQNNKCIPICMDAEVIDEKQLLNHSYLLSFYKHDHCSNSNQICFNQPVGCLYQCFDYCLECIFGQCVKCDESLGYYLQDNECLSLCGDSIQTSDEQCDDGNNNDFDGCSECRLACPKYCPVCNEELCSLCQEGFYLNPFNNCLPILGDGIVTDSEKCDLFSLNPFDGLCFNGEFICGEQCTLCYNGVCLQCNSQKGYYLNELTSKCESLCGDSIISFDEQCESDLKSCFNCQYACSQQCTLCQYSVCYTCAIGYQLINNQCENTCGDGVIQQFEECDDQNYEPYDGCFNCSFSCQKECTSCMNGKCFECQTAGWVLEPINEVCTPICGDMIVVGYEQCDDGNFTPFDGCYDCKLQCQEPCTKCQMGACFECDTPGWFLDINLCNTICGDGILAGAEQCDDGNDIQYDGCYNCEFDCQQSCLTCHYGYCFLCQVGWSFNEYKCEPICGDLIVVEVEQCDDGNDVPNDGCHDCLYSCDVNCQLCGSGVCIECNSGWEVSPTGVCYPICGDKIVQEGYEDCDDGNNVEFDGCFNCQYSCHEACTKCLFGQCKQCNTLGWTTGGDNYQCSPLCGDGIVIPPEECDDQNLVAYDGCYNCKYQCHSECLSCLEGVCVQCNFGWYQENRQCNTQCGDGIYISSVEQCDDGNLNDGDGCARTCQIEENYECNNSDIQPSICVYSQLPYIILTEIANDANTSTCKLKFNQQMKLQQKFYYITNYTQYIKVELENHVKDDYQIEITLIQEPKLEEKDVEFTIFVTFLTESTQTTLQVTLLNNLESTYGRQLKTLTQSLELTQPRVISEQTKENAQQLSEFSQDIMISIGVVSTVSLLTGSTAIFQNMLEQLQFLSYIKYVNVIFPENLQIYFDAFKIVSLNPILRLFKIDILIDSINGSEDSYIKPQRKFANDGVNAYFLDNFVSFLFCISFAYLSYYFSKIGSNLLYQVRPYEMNDYQLKNKAILSVRKELKSFQQDFYYSGLIQVFLANYYDISFASLLQITNFNFNNNNFVINSIASILVFAGQIWITYKLMAKSQQFIKKSSFTQKDQFSALFEGVKNSSQLFWSLQMNTLLSIKKLFFMITIITVQDNGALQSVLIAFQSSLYLLYLVKGQPLSSPYEYTKAVISETITVFNTLVFLTYVAQEVYPITYSFQLIIGWINIAAFTSQLVATFLIDFAQQSKLFFDKFKQLISKPDINQKQKFFFT